MGKASPGKGKYGKNKSVGPSSLAYLGIKSSRRFDEVSGLPCFFDWL
jgi:hypothetical protein